MTPEELLKQIKDMRNDMIRELAEINGRKDILLNKITQLNYLIDDYEEEMNRNG